MIATRFVANLARRRVPTAAAATVTCATLVLAGCEAILGLGNESDYPEGPDASSATDATVTPDSQAAQGEASTLPPTGDGAVPPSGLDAMPDVAAADSALPDTGDAGAPLPPLVCDGGCTAGTYCSFGACVAGNCSGGADCPDAGALCIKNTCSPCGQDFQCVAAYGPNYACVSQQCVLSPCAVGQGMCGLGHLCCPPNDTTSTLACVAGSCCSVGNTDPSCVNNHHVPHACGVVTSDGGPLAYLVNPPLDAGVDYEPSGTAICPFQTITQALTFIGTPSAPTIVTVLSEDTTPEVQPLAVPQNVRLEGASGISPPLGLPRVVLAYPASGISNFYVSDVSAVGAVDRTTSIQYLVAAESAQIYVAASTPAGGVTIGPGIDFSDTSAHPNLEIVSGSVRLIGGGGGDAVVFGPTNPPGISVTAWGSIDVDGALDGGLVSTNGLTIQQAPSTIPFVNTVQGLDCVTEFSSASKSGPGITVYGGSSLVLRDSKVSNNPGAGILILEGTDGTAASSFTGAIDLGSPTSPGRNALSNNCGASLWLYFIPSSPILAEGNIFGANDCSSGSPALSEGIAVCSPAAGGPSGTSYDVAVPAVDGGLVPGLVDVSHCTLP